MSSRPQVSSAAVFDSRMFETDCSFALSSATPSAVSCPSVLLVGRSGSWGTPVLRCLEKYETELTFAAPEAITAESLRITGYSIILLDSTVPLEQRKQLVADLTGSAISIFYTFPVENDCWWLPVLRKGQDCHGSPAFRRNEFPSELERMLQDQAEA
jgi:hypothetical protein